MIATVKKTHGTIMYPNSKYRRTKSPDRGVPIVYMYIQTVVANTNTNVTCI